jgi:rhodanese-related sulfurtransferase/DNA-directed RNA polymerase subunit RPC12/RpoP
MKNALMFAAVIVLILFTTGMKPDGDYQCMPCGNDCDKAAYDKPGECPHCHMTLVKKSTVMFKSIQPTEICGHIAKHPEIILLDVRTREEFEGKADDYGTLKNAINIPIQELESRIAEINDMKEKEIIVYCSHSHRSPRASYFLTQHGFKNVTNMEGGMSTMKDNSCKK